MRNLFIVRSESAKRQERNALLQRKTGNRKPRRLKNPAGLFVVAKAVRP